MSPLGRGCIRQLELQRKCSYQMPKLISVVEEPLLMEKICMSSKGWRNKTSYIVNAK